MSSLNGSRVAVVGGSSGIGFAVAEAAIAEGATVTIVSSRAERVARAVERLGGGANGLVADAKDETALAAALERAGPQDHLAFTAGDWDVMGAVPTSTLDLKAAERVFAVRFWGAIAATKHVLPRISPGGSITLTDGLIAHQPRKGAVVNSAMAGAVEHLARALAVDLAPLRVNAVCPGLVRTEVWDRIPEDARDGEFQKMTARQPIDRIGEPSEIAQAYLFFMRCGFATGQVLKVDGGRSLTPY